MINNSKVNDLSETILKVLKEKKPQSVKQLLTMLKESGFEEKQVLDCVLKLKSEGLINLEDDALQSDRPPAYQTSGALWYLLTITAGIVTLALVFEISPDFYPWAYIRTVFGVVFVLFLPGFAFIKAFFRVKNTDTARSGSLEIIERIALSVGVSIAMVSLIGLILYFSPFGMDLSAIVVSLFVFTSIFATVALLRDSKFR